MQRVSDSDQSKQARAAEQQPATKRKRKRSNFNLIVAAVAVWGLAVFFVVWSRIEGTDATVSAEPPAAAAPTATRSAASGPAPSGTSGATTAGAATPAGSSAAAAPVAAGSSAAPVAAGSSAAVAPVAASRSAAPTPPPAGANACLHTLFAPGAFVAQEPELQPICEETNPRRAEKLIQTQLIRGGGDQSTAASREWAGLGWFGMAAAAIVRGRCCGSATPPLAWPWQLACPLNDNLKQIHAAAQASDVEQLRTELDGYSRSVSCLSRSGEGKGFKQPKPPAGAGAGILDSLLERLPQTKR